MKRPPKHLDAPASAKRIKKAQQTAGKEKAQTGENGLSNTKFNATVVSELPTKCIKPLPTRKQRIGLLLNALWWRDSVTREQGDRIAFASNSPDMFGRLRRGWGLEIPCKEYPKLLPNGEPTTYGVYWLTDDDRARLLALGWEGWQ